MVPKRQSSGAPSQAVSSPEVGSPRRRCLAYLSVLLLGLFLAQSAYAQPAADEIRATRQASNEALKRHDMQAFAASLADDFVAVAGSGASIPSRQDYIDRLTKDFADPKSFRYERIVDSVDLSEAPLAAEHGHWIGFAPDGTRAIGGTYLAMWRRTDAGWKIRSELFVLLKCYEASACDRYRKR